ncbi:MAG: alpha/beta hydrolase [Alphaproteobacteria bacterium]
MTELKSAKHAIHYEVIDLTAPWIEARETILFHHGVGANWRCWLGWTAALVDRYRLVVFDMPGHGQSQPGDDGITIADLTANIIALADTLDCAKFHLVGESIGGTVALQVALDHPDRLSSLTVSNGAHVGGSIENVRNWDSVINGEGMGVWSDQMMAGRFFDGVLSPEAWAWYRSQQASADGGTVLALLRTLVGADLSARLPEISAPTLLLHPDSSPFVPVPIMADLHERIPNAQLKIFPDAKHGLPFSHARECSQALRQFLDGIT